MATAARRRLLRDFRRLQSDPPQGITGSPSEQNILLWQALIFGPEDTPWEGGTFKVRRPDACKAWSTASAHLNSPFVSLPHSFLWSSPRSTQIRRRPFGSSRRCSTRTSTTTGSSALIFSRTNGRRFTT
mmetsp:Transcript_31789/g.101048  ORF Transcript_31789/g.101048 Transcript_31789/m.101048 type:complete len:129 (-) Transcript_31789:2115-2501(-)